MADVARTEWSSMQEVAIRFGNQAQQPNPAVEEFAWEDTTFTSLGGEWDINDQWTLRVGFAEDSTPTQANTRTPRLPDADRTWMSFGATWAPSESWEISGGYTRIDVDNPSIQLTPSSATSGSSLNGTYEATVDLWGLSAQFKF
jgi:long-chain fatty acid transport protein